MGERNRLSMNPYALNGQNKETKCKDIPKWDHRAKIKKNIRYYPSWVNIV